MESTKYDIYLNKVWVQCENNSCFKWRLLPQDNTSSVDPNAPWYCYMNPDPRFNQCTIPEEHFPEASQMQKHGLKYVYSKFPLGSVVLVKMCTWPSWPGILCPDPANGQYVAYDSNGDVESYHVEFLGKPHSRIWAAVNSIRHFPSSFKADVCKRRKAWYASALEEAQELLGHSVQQRLEMCYLSKKGTLKDDITLCRNPIKAWPKNCWKDSSYRTARRRMKRMVTCLPETASSEDVFSRKNMVVSETEIILKDLDQILKQIAVSCTPSIESFVNGEDNRRDKVTNYCVEFTEKGPVEINTLEDCIVIDGKAFKAEECIENITDRFKEIDSLMAEFQQSL